MAMPLTLTTSPSSFHRRRLFTNSPPPPIHPLQNRTRKLLAPAKSKPPPLLVSGWVGIGSASVIALCSMGSRRREDSVCSRVGGEGIQDEEEEINGGFARLMTLPTVLTLARVAAVPILVSTYYMYGWWATTATTGIFIAAAFTDWLDGYLARKMRLGTVFGAFLDLVADKLMVAATLVLLFTKPLEVSTFKELPWLLTAPSIAIIGREITMSAVREWAASQNSKILEAVAVNNLGKWKTATQMTALTVLATRDPRIMNFLQIYIMLSEALQI